MQIFVQLICCKILLAKRECYFICCPKGKLFISSIYFCKLMCIWSGEVVRLGSTTAGDVVPCPCSLAQWDVATRVVDTHRNFHHSLAATTLSLLDDIKCSLDNTYSNLVYIQLLMQGFFTIWYSNYICSYFIVFICLLVTLGSKRVMWLSVDNILPSVATTLNW